MKSEKIIQMKHVIIIYFYNAEIITNSVKALNLVCSHKMFEKDIYLNLEKKTVLTES